jgi:hypothetical protein
MKDRALTPRLLASLLAAGRAYIFRQLLGHSLGETYTLEVEPVNGSRTGVNTNMCEQKEESFTHQSLHSAHKTIGLPSSPCWHRQ